MHALLMEKNRVHLNRCLGDGREVIQVKPCIYTDGLKKHGDAQNEIEIHVPDMVVRKASCRVLACADLHQLL